MNKRHRLLKTIVTIAVVWLGARWVISRVQPGHQLGVVNGHLAACPDSPNCVSSQAQDPEQRMEPLPLVDSPEESIEKLHSIITQMPRATIVSSAEKYLHAEVRSLLMGFVDDVEFLVDDTAGVIHFRSASRVGHSDMGVNRARMEEIASGFGKP